MNDTKHQLASHQCQACQADATKLTEAQIADLACALPDWQVIHETVDGKSIAQLSRVYTFKNFKQAMAFSNQLADLAEAEGHHPGILTEWGKVTVTWWSHSIKGLHKNDFIMAAKTDQLTD